MDYNRQPITTVFSDAVESNSEYCPKCGKKNDKVQVPTCGVPVTCSTDGTVISGPEDCPWGFPDIKPISKDVERRDHRLKEYWEVTIKLRPETREDVDSWPALLTESER